MAPDVFEDAGGHSRVRRDPAPTPNAAARAALVACPPLRSAPTTSRMRKRRGLPRSGSRTRWASAATPPRRASAWSYFVQRPDGNVLVDSPRAAAPLLERLYERGGVRFLFLTHGDDVADHDALRGRFRCERVMHGADGLHGLEHYVDGAEPVALASDLLLIPMPGHTPGSLACSTATPSSSRATTSGGTRSGRCSRLPVAQLVFLGRAAPVDRTTPRLRVPLGAARPRPAPPGRVRGGHAPRAGAGAPPPPRGLTGGAPGLVTRRSARRRRSGSVSPCARLTREMAVGLVLPTGHRHLGARADNATPKVSCEGIVPCLLRVGCTLR